MTAIFDDVLLKYGDGLESRGAGCYGGETRNGETRGNENGNRTFIVCQKIVHNHLLKFMRCLIDVQKSIDPIRTISEPLNEILC